MEVWKDLPEYEGIYEVSSLGNISKMGGREKGILKPNMINSGYLTVSLYKDKRRKHKLVHRAVARAFCEGYSKGLDVNHKDGDRTNNHYTNLEWVTRKENIRDCMKRGKHDYKSAHKVAHKKRRKPVEVINKETGEKQLFESARKASKFIGAHENNVSRVARGERKTVMGFLVKYI